MSGDRERSLVIGIVSSLDDPENLGRVKVTYPYRDDQESHWCRLVAPFAGRDRGAFFRPDPGDEVLVALQQGDARQPYILGGLWSAEDTPPPDDGKAAENNWRFIVSRSGHVVKLNDTDGAETIEIVDKTGNNSIVFDTASNTITVAADQKVTVEAQTVEVKGTTTVKVEAPTVEVKGSGSLSLEAPSIDVKASGTLNLQGALVRIN